MTKDDVVNSVSIESVLINVLPNIRGNRGIGFDQIPSKIRFEFFDLLFDKLKINWFWWR